MSNITFFTTEPVSKVITKIRTVTGELCYLIKGNQSSVLVDTGTGLGKLHDFVTTLTDKEPIALLTHGHVDHAFGTEDFSEVYMNSKDMDILKEQSDESRKGYSKMCMGDELFSELKEEDFKFPKLEGLKELKGGMSFDLGDVHLDIFDSPGHTQGSVSILIREERAIILGDSCNPRTFLFDDDYSLCVKDYCEALKKLKDETDGKYDTVLLSHGPGKDKSDMIASALELCEDIMTGKSDEVPFNFMGSIGYVAKKTDENGKRLDGGSANIVYNKNRVFS